MKRRLGMWVCWGLVAAGGLASARGGEVPPVLEAEISWTGNSFSGNPAWIPQNLADIFVTPDGDLFTNIPWEEGGGNVTQITRDGAWAGAAYHTHGWGNNGGYAVAANDNYLFIGGGMENENGGLKDLGTWPPKGFYWIGVSRRPRDNIRAAAPFPGGKGGAGDTLKESFLVLAEIPDKNPDHEILRGLVANEEHLYASLRQAGVVLAFDAETMKELARFPLERADRLALDPAGGLWALQAPVGDKGAWRLVGLDVQTGAVRTTFAFPDTVHPSDMAFGPDGTLFVSDDGPNHQVQVVVGLTGAEPAPRLDAALGAWGGVFAGPVPGEAGPLRFKTPRAVGVDGEGNLYVANDGCSSGGGTVLESYAPGGELRWRRYGLHFVDITDFDPATNRIYTKEEIFEVDLDAPAGENWTYKAYTFDPVRFPDDPRGRLEHGLTSAFYRVLDGQPFLFMTGMSGPAFAVYRFDPENHGHILIPSNLFARYRLADGRWPEVQPPDSGWRWRDNNGDARMQADEFSPNDRDGNDVTGMFPTEVDMSGRIWWGFANEIRAYEFVGVDERGVPDWDWDNPMIFPRPEEDFDHLRRVVYEPESGRMLIGGGKGEDRHQHWKPMGPIVSMYEGVLAGEPRKIWTIKLAYESGSGGHTSHEPMGMAVAGEYIFVPYVHGLKDEGTTTAFVKVLRLDTGEVVGNLVPEQVVGELGLMDVETPITAKRLEDGRYVILLEDDYKAKNVMFVWRP